MLTRHLNIVQLQYFNYTINTYGDYLDILYIELLLVLTFSFH